MLAELRGGGGSCILRSRSVESNVQHEATKVETRSATRLRDDAPSITFRAFGTGTLSALADALATIERTEMRQSLRARESHAWRANS